MSDAVNARNLQNSFSLHFRLAQVFRITSGKAVQWSGVAVKNAGVGNYPGSEKERVLMTERQTDYRLSKTPIDGATRLAP